MAKHLLEGGSLLLPLGRLEAGGLLLTWGQLGSGDRDLLGVDHLVLWNGLLRL